MLSKGLALPREAGECLKNNRLLKGSAENRPTDVKEGSGSTAAPFRLNSRQPDLFIPTPTISGETNASGRDVWYCRRRMTWTVDPADLFLTDAQLLAKYGPAVSPECRP